MKILMFIMLAIILCGVAFSLYGREKTWQLLIGPADLGPIDFATFTPSNKPNHALFCPQDYCPNAKRQTISPIFDFPVKTLKDKLYSIMIAEQNIERVAKDDENLEYRFVHYTPLMRFPDTIRIKFIALDEGKSTLAIFSESQIGHGDMSVNYKRINRWVRLLESS